jgi:hypothetical protein
MLDLWNMVQGLWLASQWTWSHWSTHLSITVPTCPLSRSVRPSVHPSVRPSVRLFVRSFVCCDTHPGFHLRSPTHVPLTSAYLPLSPPICATACLWNYDILCPSTRWPGCLVLPFCLVLSGLVRVGSCLVLAVCLSACRSLLPLDLAIRYILCIYI